MSSFGGLDVNVDDDDNDGIGGIIVNIRKKKDVGSKMLPVSTCLSFQGSKDRWPFELASRWTSSLYLHL